MALYQRLVKEVDDAQDDLPIYSMFAELIRYRRGERGKAAIKTNLGLSEDEWNHMMALNTRLDSVANESLLMQDMRSVLIGRENSLGQAPGLRNWNDYLAEVDAWIATGAYS